MTSTSARPSLRRREFGLAASTLLMLSACGLGSEDAKFADEGGSDGSGSSDASDGGGSDGTAKTAPELPRVDSAFMTEEFTQDIAITETIRPERAEIITPTGTLAVNEVRAVDSVSGDQVGLGAPSDGGGEEGTEGQYGPAEGEAFRIVDLTFTPLVDEEDPWGMEDGPTTAVSISVNGTQKHLRDLVQQEDISFLMSVPEDGSGQLVVSSEGHDQVVDLLSGERQEDEVAAAYYRPSAVQEPHHKLTIDSLSFPMVDGSGPDSPITTAFSFQIASASLTAWTKDGGWAEPGMAWLVVVWSYDVALETEGYYDTNIEEITSTLSIDVDGEVTTDDIHLEDEFGATGDDGEVTSYASVPVDMTDATLSVAGSATVGSASGFITPEGDGSAEFASEEYALSFPAAE